MRATTNLGGWFLLCAAAGLLALVSCGDNPAGPTGLLDLDQLADDNLVLDGPIARINASATIAIAPATIKFSAAGSVSPFGDIVAYEWDFGAGDTVGASETYHTFVDPGLHTVHLTVYDQIGESGSAAAQVAVLPEVQIACAPAGARGPAPLRLEARVVSIDGTSSLPGDVEFRWDFGDGGVGEGPHVVHVYERPGRYTLVLVLALGALTLQGDQLVVTVDGPIVAENQPPVADAGADQVVVDEDDDGAEFVLLDGSGSYDPDGKIVWYRWALTEGSRVLAVGPEPKCEVPLAVGQHDITLTVTDDRGAQDSDSVLVAVVARAALSELTVTPADDFASEGEVGGAFSPGQIVYTLTNVGQEELDWTATKTQSWVSLSSAGGTLVAGASTTVTVSINAAADALAAGSYSDTVTFTNTTTHSGDTTRGVSLTVNPPAGVLAVTPGTNLVSSGTVGGPFTPSSQAYTLQNTGGQSLNWTATKTQSWVSLSSAGGTLAAGASTTVTVSINAAADALAAGSYSDTVTFTNTTTHSGDTTRGVSLTVSPPLPLISGRVAETGGTGVGGVVLAGLPDDPTTDSEGYYQASVPASWSGTVTPTKAGYTFEPASRAYAGVTSDQPDQDHTATPPEEQWADHVSQYGITWTFDKPYRVGQFVNGDWWVCSDTPEGTVTVQSVDPAPTGSGSTARHGSMLNPMGQASQSYDGRGNVYTDDNKVAYPVVLSPWDSLMSSVSRADDAQPEPDVWGYLTYLSQSKLKTIAVLTCMPHDSSDLNYMFRPPYSYPFGGSTADKQLFDSRDINYELLPSLTPVAGYPSMATATRGFQRVCPMHVSGSASQNIRPYENCSCYYREQHTYESRSALLMLCDPAIVGDRTEFVRNFIQFGIDTRYALASYDPNSPNRNDRCISKWPMVFAGLMLDDEDFHAIPASAVIKTEDTAYGECWTGADVIWGSHELLHYDEWCSWDGGGISGYKNEVYRRQTHSWIWVGTALAARIMQAQEAWDHDAFFDYIDRWMLFGDYADDDDAYDTLQSLVATNPCDDSPPLSAIGYRQGQVPGQTWVKNMWDQYRSP